MYVILRYQGQLFADFYKEDGQFEEIKQSDFEYVVNELKIVISMLLIE